MKDNRITKLFNIEYPVIQAGMIWCSGSKLAAAVSNSGGLGLVGAGSMKPDLLKIHLDKMTKLTSNPWGVNLPVFSKYADEQIELILKSNASVVFTSAGSPKRFTNILKKNGFKVVHVVPSPILAKKCEEAGVDAIVAEGFEAGGHNGVDELTTMVLIPEVIKSVSIPIIAAGGISLGSHILAAMSLGADAVQIGTRFAATIESSAHQNYKEALVNAGPDSTKLMMKKIMPVRILKNKFYSKIQSLEDNCATKEEILDFLGKGKAMEGIFGGDIENGEVELGQVAMSIYDIPTVAELMIRLIEEYRAALRNIPQI
jgi:enoyl-[acyl-carrier protein] reductase II